MPEQKIISKEGFIIARVSTEEQIQDDRYGIPIQLKRLSDFVKQNKLKIVKQFQFPESAFKGKRKKFVAAVDEIITYAKKKGKTIAIIVDDQDRLTRKVFHKSTFDIMQKCREEGILEILCPGLPPLNSKSEYWVVQLYQQEWFRAEGESARKSEAVKRTILMKLERGEFPGFAPTGYLNDSKGKTLVYDDLRAPGVKRMFELYSNMDFSGDEVAKVLRNDGMTMKPTAGNQPRPIQRKDVNSLLKKRVYTGEFQWEHPETGEPAIWKGNFKPLISKALFEKVQKIIEERAAKYSTRHEASTSQDRHKLQGILTCDYCGCRMSPNDVSVNYGKPKGTIVSYRCTYGKKDRDSDWYKNHFGENHSGISKRKVRVVGKGFSKKQQKIINCPQLYWATSSIDEAIKMKLLEFSKDRKVIKPIIEQMQADWEERVTANEARRKPLRNRIDKLERDQTKAYKNLALAESSKYAEGIKKVIDKIESDIEKAKEELDGIAEEKKVDTNELFQVLDAFVSLGEEYEKLHPRNQRRLLMQVFKDIRLRKGWLTKFKDIEPEDFRKRGHITFKLTEPFQLLFEKWEREMESIIKKEGTPKGGGGTSKASINKTKMREPGRAGL